ncbi:N-acetylmuramoyl-L-alanine amidase [Rhodococcus sp. NPDC058532]|uniref:N-acetylmuramoyl-L-alanine amidase n=1 Tax=Rhodococcus sp. NPDC058532 TaxID=3346540 RepID=UPI00364CFD75
MPHRRPKSSIVLGTVAAVAIAAPFAVWGVSSTSGIRSTSDSSPVAVPTQIAEIALAQIPDIVVPVKELTGLDLPDLRLSDLKKLPLPSEIAVPQGLPLPEGITLPETITLPTELLPSAPSDVAEPVAPAPAENGAPAPAEELGTAVKEIVRDTPFSMIALTSELGATAAKVRARLADGSWGPWFATEQLETGKNDRAAGGKTGTEPVYVGDTTAVQVLVTKAAEAVAGTPSGSADAAPAGAAQPADPARPNVLTPTDPSKDPIAFAPAAVSTPLRAQDPAQALADAVTAVLIQPGSGDADASLSDIATSVGGSGPRVITRAQWGADESLRCDGPTYDDSLGGATVHHTAGSNDYTRAESAGIVRSIYAYHAQTLGWCDVGYNVLVDKYGQIFEGRAGGLDRNVQGAHAGGFNENTMGIAMMGDFSTVSPPQATVDAVGRFLGWRLAKAGLDPQGRTTMWSEGTEFTPYPQGAAVDLPIIFAHRDVGNTSCPGDSAYTKMNEIRAIAKANPDGGSSSGSGVLAAAPANPAPDAAPPAPPASGGALPFDTGSADSVVALVDEILKLTDQSPIAQKWIAEGGDTGRLGAALTGELPAKAGNLLVKFANGVIATSPNGGVWTVLGKIYETWQQSGLDAGTLGLPISDEYAVPDGMRAEFEKGSLIFNEVTGVVTTVLRAYNGAAADVAAPVAGSAPQAPAPAEAPAPAPAEALVPAPAPAG